MVKQTFLTFPDLDQICDIREKLVLSSLFFDFWSKSLKSDEKTNFSHISQIWTRFAKFEKSWFYHHFSLISGLNHKKVMRKQTFLTFPRSESDFKTFSKLLLLFFFVFPRFLFTLLAMYWFYWFSHHFLMVWTRNSKKVMAKPIFLTFHRFDPDARNSRKVGFLYGFCWF